MKRIKLKLKHSMGGQVGVGGALLLVAGIEGLEPWQRLLGVFAVWCVGALITNFAHGSNPDGTDVAGSYSRKRR